MKTYQSFSEFYPSYLSEHRDRRNRRMHFLGSCLVLVSALAALALHNFVVLAAMPVVGYGSAWFGHFVFEKNNPATFTHPIYSLMGDWLMFWQILTRRVAL